MPDRYLVLVPAGDEFHVATRGGRLVTTTERSQIGLGRIEGRRPPVILASNTGEVPTVDLWELVTDQAQPAAPASEPTAAPAAPETPRRAVRDNPQA
jgi:hypothetical protein